MRLTNGVRAGPFLGAPAGTSENIEKLIAPAGSRPGITEHLYPLMERDADGIIAADVRKGEEIRQQEEEPKRAAARVV